MLSQKGVTEWDNPSLGSFKICQLLCAGQAASWGQWNPTWCCWNAAIWNSQTRICIPEKCNRHYLGKWHEGYTNCLTPKSWKIQSFLLCTSFFLMIAIFSPARPQESMHLSPSGCAMVTLSQSPGQQLWRTQLFVFPGLCQFSVSQTKLCKTPG